MRKKLLIAEIESLETQLRYYLNRIKDFPEKDMVELIHIVISERLEKMKNEIQ